MNFIVFAALSATGSLAGVNVPPAPAPFIAPYEEESAQMTITRRTVVRITPVQQRPIRWKESGGPKCVEIGALAGVAIRERDSVDLILRGGNNFRARLEKGCPSTDFYSGFYLKRTKDGRICAVRDMLHSRTGGTCQIERFRTLKPEIGK